MRFLTGLLVLGMSLWTTQAYEIGLSEKEGYQEYCTGMYSKTSWGGPVDPFILVKFLNTSNSDVKDPIASLVIFEWKDRNLVGIPDPNTPGNRLGVCGDDFVKQGYCNKTDIGKFILHPDVDKKSSSVVLTKAVHLNDAAPINYAIKKTGYYCVLTDVVNTKKYDLVVEYRNAYGELEATQIPKLPFYGGMSILYALLAAYWGFLYYQHRHDILAVQNYITAILVFLVVEMLITWGFYEYQNRHGSNVGSKVFLTIVGILNAGRNSFSFFLLLIVCMGYGVVKHTLGRTMIRVRWLAAAHFLFGLVYSLTFLSITPETAGPFVLLIVLPLAGTLTAFYVWTLNSLNWTLKDLRERKQHAKEAMYRKLWWAILISVMVIFGFFFFNSFTFASASDPDFVPFHWKTRWFILDGWLNVVYFADVAWIAYLWRPTSNNRRFAMSDEIAQDDDGNFDLGDIGVPGEDSDDEDVEVGKTRNDSSNANGLSFSSASQSSAQPPRNNTRPAPRESLENETIFAIGEDGDKFSDDGSDEEDAKLVKTK
ncbi:major facilitator superfamily transporter [Fusarium bulbicola]|uniref:PTM1-member of the major facilitator superfamily n=2 Tax=Fusarium fujikuroi species complex TaxID=171627 RepID=A0A8H5KUA6_GIBSU|nr:PTM1-member of the major facilitator superfamily [Fusarium subglutinans]KAF5578943.1 PTM1-member of the major facilitator superfamily [Fusarium subglutinans]KAF5685474.1 PTM1-member of the major facilitator superfamily [Fusarium circinatum]KAF5972757.1 major facilitator superfamily transporter [Fusarium bulbicola]